MKILKKKTFLMSLMALTLPVVVLSFFLIAHYKHTVSFEMKPKDTVSSEKKRTRLPSQIEDDNKMNIDDLKKNILAGNIFGPRGFPGRTIVEFNMDLNNLGTSYYGLMKTWPLFFENDRCFIHAYGKSKVKQVKRKMYGLFQIIKPPESYNNGVEIMVSNIYVRPAYLWIKVKDVSINTSLSQLEEICSGVFSFK